MSLKEFTNDNYIIGSLIEKVSREVKGDFYKWKEIL